MRLSQGASEPLHLLWALPPHPTPRLRSVLHQLLLFAVKQSDETGKEERRERNWLLAVLEPKQSAFVPSVISSPW